MGVWQARVFLIAGSLCGLSGVAMSALAAHALGGRVSPQGLDAVRSAVAMQGWHAAALLFTALWAPRGGRWARGAGWAFIAGILLFCGAVYGHELARLPVSAGAPFGGSLLMLGWLLLAISAGTAAP